MKNIKNLPKETGLYLVKNKQNGACYVGQAINIYKRFNNHHIYDYLNPNNCCYNTKFYKALRKYGLENFEVSVLELCDSEELDAKEIEYIKQYDSYYHGYNSTEGGQNWSSNIHSPEVEAKRKATLEEHKSLQSENHPRAKLTNEQVWDIRQRYKDGEGLDSIYQDFKDLYSSKAVFGRIVRGQTYQSVGNIPSKEDKIKAGKFFTPEQIIAIRNAYYVEDKTQTSIAKLYNTDVSTIKQIVHRESYKEVKDNIPNLKQRKQYRLTPEQVVEIRQKSDQGKSVIELAKEYHIGESAIRKCINRQTYKNIK